MNLVPLRRALLLAALCGCASAPAPIDPDDFAPVPDDHPESAARLRGSRATAAPTAAPIAPPQSSPWRRLYRRWVRLTGERCNGLDDDGDGEIDEVYRDADGDGLANCVDTELCDGVDNDGDGDRDEGFDVDGDGRADCEVPCGGPGVALSPVNVCADGLLGPDEACDDGNTDWGDGCSPACETEGCTLSQGYWKTHSANQPPPRRDPWPLPESTPLCGTTWEMILSTPVAGRPFVVLAHQYIAPRRDPARAAAHRLQRRQPRPRPLRQHLRRRTRRPR
jgi:cysteine-rich repeat protein